MDYIIANNNDNQITLEKNNSTEFLVNGYLNNYGLCIKKCKIDNKILSLLKINFNVIPKNLYDEENAPEDDKSFDVFYEDENYIVLPKFMANNTLKLQNNIIINNKKYNKIFFNPSKYSYKKEVTDFNFTGNLREYQKDIITTVLDKIHANKNNNLPKGGLIKLSCGS
jgi:hypothetical protein